MTPRWCRLDGLLEPDLAHRLAEWAGVAVARMGPDLSSCRPAASDSAFLRLDDELERAVRDAIVGLVPLIRSELGLPYFPVGSIEFVVAADAAGGSCHGPVADPTSEAGPRHIEFVHHLAGITDGSAIRLVDHGSEPTDDAAADTGVVDVAVLEHSTVFFPSGSHHEVVRAPDGRRTPVQLTLRGWIRSAVAGATRSAEVRDPLRINELQSRYLPRFSASGFEIRPTPRAVHELLRSLLELRGDRRRPEDADRVFHLADDNDFIDVTDLSADILHALQPLHEHFAGVPLVPTALYGLRSYREGARLAMHTDRIETHVISSIIQVAQDVDECWPLQLAVGSRVHDVVLNPGQLVLYEGASTMHGRIRPLRGRSFVNVFAHYRPVDWDWTETALLERAAILDG